MPLAKSTQHEQRLLARISATDWLFMQKVGGRLFKIQSHVYKTFGEAGDWWIVPACTRELRELAAVGWNGTNWALELPGGWGG